MAIYRVMDGKLVSEDRVPERFAEPRETTRSRAGSPTPPEFEPVGLGRPMTIEIRSVYTGASFHKQRDMLVTTAMRSVTSYNAAPRAVNFLKPKVAPRSMHHEAGATEQGTPIVFYSPALVDSGTVITVELGFDEFPDQVFGQVGDMFSQLAAIPAFIMQSTYLLGAGALIKFLGKLGSQVFDRPAVFSATEPLRFNYPGSPTPTAGLRLLTQDDFPTDVIAEYKPNAKGVLEKNGQRYDGDHPYVVLLLDGRRHDDYQSFTASHASAALLERFFKLRENQSTNLDLLVDAMRLYNDWGFRKKADALMGRIKDLPQSSEERTTLEAEYRALVDNIGSAVLKPATS